MIILDIIHRLVFLFKYATFGDGILSSSLGGTYSDEPNRKIYSVCGH
jgi:hypothetical protein